MKFSDKEKKILKIAGVLFFIVIYFNYYLGFEFKQINALKEQKAQLINDEQEMAIIKATLGSADDEVKRLKTDMMEIRKIYPQEINYDELLLVIKEIEEYSEMKITNINVDEIKILDSSTPQTSKENEDKIPVIISDKKLQKLGEELGISLNREVLKTNSLTDKTSKIDKIPDGKGYSADVTISAKTNYLGLKKFIGGIEALKNNVSFKKVDINRNGDGSITTNIVMSFYGIKDSIAKMPEQVVPVQMGQINLFKAYTGYDEKSAVDANYDENLYFLADFTSRLLPYVKGLPLQTLTISAKNVVISDSIGGGVIFGDTEGVDNAQLYIEEKDSKFMFKMKTGSQAYPDKAFEKMYEFKPLGDRIMFLIDSTFRKSLSDNSSVNFEITNNSSKIMDVIVINDDKEKPRVAITMKTSNIEVKN